MELVADEGVDKIIVERLRHDGHGVHYVAESLRGTADDEILKIANAANALLITADKDFGELVFRQRQATSGVVLLRLGGISKARKVDVVSLAVTTHGSELLGAFTVIEPGLIRIRPTFE